MVVGALKLRLRVYGTGSLKEKRRILKSIKDKLLNMNVAVAEVEDHDKWQAAGIGVAVVSNEAGYVNSVIDRVMDVVDSYHDVEVLDSQFEIIHL